ncbi:hypothetical protein ADL00_29715 [Streptomyces sp. AS58]|nr:hypothetical protein ADL00_29715 [Streptomyces sp. AS58]
MAQLGKGAVVKGWAEWSRGMDVRAAGWMGAPHSHRGGGGDHSHWQWMDCGASAPLLPLEWMEHTEWRDHDPPHGVRVHPHSGHSVGHRPHPSIGMGATVNSD